MCMVFGGIYKDIIYSLNFTTKVTGTNYSIIFIVKEIVYENVNIFLQVMC